MELLNPSVLLTTPSYERRRPEATLFYQLIQENLETFLAQVDRESNTSLPDFVKKEFYEYLKCGILAHGFLRAKCEECKHEKLVAFSCKRRGFCSSCGSKRMVETAAHLVEQVFPELPMRQWVLSFPFGLRLLFAQNPKVMSKVLGIVNRAVSTLIIKKTGLRKKQGARSGAVTLIQCFGGSLNLNLHFHTLFLEGAYTFNDGVALFHRAKGPSQQELQKLLKNIIKRVTRYLVKKGYLICDEGEEYFQLSNEIKGFERLLSSSTTYKIAFGPNAGKKAFQLRTLPEKEEEVIKSKFLARDSGFSLHAGVYCNQYERKKLERLCRYISRPPVAEKRLSLNQAGQVTYRLKKPYNDGTTHIVLDPLDFLARLASLVPKPRVNLTRYFGVFSSNFKHRRLVVPRPKVTEPQKCKAADSDKKKIYQMTWAQRLARVFDIDIEKCPECGGKVRVIASIEDPQVIKKILGHLNLPTKPPTIYPPRGPPGRDGQESFEEPFETQSFPDYE